jgi:hypothetical protein
MHRTAGAVCGAAISFAGATAYNSAVAVCEDVPGEPLGLRVPLSVRIGIVVGWGSAIAAPWPMPVAGLLAAHRVARGKGSDRDSSAPGWEWRGSSGC